MDTGDAIELLAGAVDGLAVGPGMNVHIADGTAEIARQLEEIGFALRAIARGLEDGHGDNLTITDAIMELAGAVERGGKRA